MSRNSLNQNLDYLLSIDYYDYILTADFIKYIKQRTGLVIKDENLIEFINKKTIVGVPKDRRIRVKLLLGTIQDCWDVYRLNNKEIYLDKDKDKDNNNVKEVNLDDFI